MEPACVVQLTTPKKIILNGLWFGPRKAERVVIVVHGLTGSMFSLNPLVRAMVGRSTAVLTFNNRGFGIINSVKQAGTRKNKYISAGTAHEVFTDCIDDIHGAITFAKKNGAKSVYLAGHSTGCQKIVYWASKNKDRSVKGLILLGPLSDYSGALATKGSAAIQAGVAYARALVASGKPHQLMPAKHSEWFECDAQRYVSLYSPESPEEIFTYARPNESTRTLQRVGLPTLVFLAGDDEYGDLPAGAIACWFDERLKQRHGVFVIPGVSHSFKNAERLVAKRIANFMKEA